MTKDTTTLADVINSVGSRVLKKTTMRISSKRVILIMKAILYYVNLRLIIT